MFEYDFARIGTGCLAHAAFAGGAQAALPALGIGLTDICRCFMAPTRRSERASSMWPAWRLGSPRWNPANLAFNGKNAARGALGRSVDYGLQPERIGGAAIWGSAVDVRCGTWVLGCRALARAGARGRR